MRDPAGVVARSSPPEAQPAPLPDAPRAAGLLERTALVDALCQQRTTRLVYACAPVGWGKTTLLAQWRARELDDPDGREVCWIPVEGEPDPALFLERLLAGVVDARPSVGPERHTGATVSVTDSVARMTASITSELAASGTRTLLILDDVPATTTLAAALQHLLRLLPAGVQLAISTRSPGAMRLARLRVNGDVTEVGADQLRFSRDEIGLLAHRFGVPLGEAALDDVMRITLGWPAAVRVALASCACHDATAARDGLDRAEVRDRIADLIFEEALGLADDAEVDRLARSSILAHPDGPMVDTIAGSQGAAAHLAELAAAGGLVESSDHRRSQFRYHPLFRDALERRLSRSLEAEAIDDLHHRAALAFADRGDIAAVVHHAVEAGRPEVAVDAIADASPELVGSPSQESVRQWLEDLGNGSDESAARALTTGLFSALAGDTSSAMLSVLAAARHDPTQPTAGQWPSVGAAVSILATSFLDLDSDVLLGHAANADAATPESSVWFPLAALGSGRAAVLAGQIDLGRQWLTEARSVSEERSTLPVNRFTGALAGCHLALLACDAGDLGSAETDLASPEQVLSSDSWAVPALAPTFHLALATLRARQHRHEEAERDLARVDELAPAESVVGVLRLLELARVAEQQGDLGRARAHIARAQQTAIALPAILQLQRRSRWLSELIVPTALSQEKLVVPVTDAEMSVLRKLAGPFPQREIGQMLGLSLNTVKSHLRSIYQKLGVSSRSAAVHRARFLGLLLDDDRFVDADDAPQSS